MPQITGPTNRGKYVSRGRDSELQVACGGVVFVSICSFLLVSVNVCLSLNRP